MLAAGVALSACCSVVLAVSGRACEWQSDGTMSFLIDPASAGPILASVTQPVVKCAVGLPFTVLASSANAGGALGSCPITGVLRNGAGQEIPYTVSCAAGGVGQGVGAAEPAIDLGVGGSVAAADYQNAPFGGGYADRVTFQITY
jgi:hypothetical protein